MRDDRLPTTDYPPPIETAPSTSHRDQAAVNQLFDILASERRRTVLSYVMTYPGETISREEIVDAVLDCEPDEPGPISHRECLEIDLHHVHLPKLANSIIIDYDSMSGTVEYRASDDVESFLSQCLAFEKTDYSF